MNYEVRLLNSIVDTQDYVSAVNGGVENVFLEYRDVWNFIVSHYETHSKVPSKETLKQHHQDFEFISTPEPLAYYIDEAKKESLSYQTRGIVAKAHGLINESGPKEALSFLMEETSKLYKFSSNLKDTDLAGEWKDRVRDLKDRSKNPKAIAGVPSGIDVIDKVFGGREGRPLTIKAADEFKAAQTENPYTVWYKKGGQVVEETGNRTIKFKANPDFEITNTMRYKGNNPKNPYSDEMTGVIKSTGEPIKIKLANDPKAEEYVKVFKINNGKEQLHQVYTSNGTLISSPGTKGTSPKPGTMSMMEDSDKSKFFNKIKASGEAPLEQSVAKMSQADRNRMEQTLRSEINEKNRNTIQPFLDVFEKYRTIK